MFSSKKSDLKICLDEISVQKSLIFYETIMYFYHYYSIHREFHNERAIKVIIVL